MTVTASWISKKPDRCGGDACVRETRIPVWVLVGYRRLGATDADILRAYPSLASADLAAACLASTYRLMQRTADADRIMRKVPWSREKRDIGEEIYYDAVVHDAQLLYLMARHFPNLLGDTPAVARSSYIDPRLISRYESEPGLPSIPVLPPELPAGAAAETAVAALLTAADSAKR